MQANRKLTIMPKIKVSTVPITVKKPFTLKPMLPGRLTDAMARATPAETAHQGRSPTVPLAQSKSKLQAGAVRGPSPPSLVQLLPSLQRPSRILAPSS